MTEKGEPIKSPFMGELNKPKHVFLGGAKEGAPNMRVMPIHLRYHGTDPMAIHLFEDWKALMEEKMQFGALAMVMMFEKTKFTHHGDMNDITYWLEILKKKIYEGVELTDYELVSFYGMFRRALDFIEEQGHSKCDHDHGTSEE